MTTLWNSVKGYVKIDIKGLNLERVINECVSCGIAIWDVERPTHSAITASVNAKQFKKLRRIANKNNARLYLKEKHGAPFAFLWLKVRRLVLIGFMLFLLGLFASSFFVWEIQIAGNSKVSDESINNVLLASGAKIGAFWPSLDFGRIENLAVVTNREIVWAGVRMNGSRLVIEIVEQPSKEKLVEDKIPSNIIAKKDCIVSSLIAYAGKEAVSQNKAVKKGEVLISGLIGTADAPSLVQARGEVMGRVWYSGEARAKRSEVKPERTGEYNDAVIADIFLYETKHDAGYGEYEIEETKTYKIENLFLPVEIRKQRYYETRDVEVPVDEEKLMAISADMAWKQAISKIPPDAQIVDMKYNYFLLEKDMMCTGAIETMENIGVSVPIDPLESPGHQVYN